MTNLMKALVKARAEEGLWNCLLYTSDAADDMQWV